MSIQISFQSATVSLKSSLKDEALSALLEIVEKFSLKEPPTDMPLREKHRREDLAGKRHDKFVPPELTDTALEIRNQITSLEPRELLDITHPRTFVDKAFVLVAWLEATQKRTIQRRDIKQTLRMWPEEPSSNLSRDIKIAANNGWLQLGAKEVCLSEAGWDRIGNMLES